MSVNQKAQNEVRQMTNDELDKKNLSQEELRDLGEREKYLKMLDPSVIDWMKENLNIDLTSTEVKTVDLRRLVFNEMTLDAYPITVTPLVYDVEKREREESRPLKSWNSIQIFYPFEKGKPVPVDDDHQVRVITVPCRPLIKREDAEKAAVPSRNEEFVRMELSADAFKELERIGYARDRFFSGINPVPAETRNLIMAGKTFPVNGTVRTNFGVVNVCGEGRLVRSSDGRVVSQFDPYNEFALAKEEKKATGKTYYREDGLPTSLAALTKRKKAAEKKARGADTSGYAPDILSSPWVGQVKLDFYRRYRDGSLVQDGLSPLTKEAVNILDYGTSLGPVPGEYHYSKYNTGTRQYDHVVENGYYYVRIQNGSPVLEKYVKANVNDIDGKDVEAYVLPSAMKKVEGNGVRRAKRFEKLEFLSGKDKLDFLQGYGGIVKDVLFNSSSEHPYRHDAVAYPDYSGAAQDFSPSTTKAILEKRNGLDFHVDMNRFGTRTIENKKKFKGNGIK